MSDKAAMFGSVDLTDDFSARGPLGSTSFDDSPMIEGRRKLRNAFKIELRQIIAQEQVRTDFDPDELQKLAHSLKTVGQQQPIRVHFSVEAGKYVIIQGERRFRAAELAGLNELDCIVHEGPLGESEKLELQLIENIIRQDLNPVEEARAFRKLIDARGCTGKDLAAEIGLDPSTITRSLKILELPQDIQEEVAGGTLPKSVIREVQKLKSEDEQRKMIADYKAGGTYGEVAASVRAKKSGKEKADGPKTKKSFSADGIKVQVAAKRRATQAEIAAVLRQWADELEHDGRGKKAA